jgi:hypothetical protein
MGQMICCGMTAKRVGMLGINVREMKALTVKMEKVNLIGKGRYNVTWFVYDTCEMYCKMFFLSRFSFFVGHLRFGL